MGAHMFPNPVGATKRPASHWQEVEFLLLSNSSFLDLSDLGSSSVGWVCKIPSSSVLVQYFAHNTFLQDFQSLLQKTY